MEGCLLSQVVLLLLLLLLLLFLLLLFPAAPPWLRLKAEEDHPQAAGGWCGAGQSHMHTLQSYSWHCRRLVRPLRHACRSPHCIR